MWTYLQFDCPSGEPNGDIEETQTSEAIPRPPRSSFFQGFDAFRWQRVVGFRESGGHMSILDPHVDDDCEIIAFAPIDEPTAPDEEKLKSAYRFGPCYPGAQYPLLFLNAPAA